MVPNGFSYGRNLDIYVQMLNPVSYETVEGKLLDKQNKTMASGALTLSSGKPTINTYLIDPKYSDNLTHHHENKPI